uniref:Arrestin C-terminal-like domain-containing protein n=2 Tax=Phaeomonas parva TaxID=124430 RepID=A0A7S1TRZ8_9STRA
MAPTMRIELDRQDKVFYGGDVIRGTLHVSTREAITCRGIRVRLMGKGYCHWVEGSGDNKQHYIGRKTYQELSTTVFGNFYKTSLLDNAGEDARFGNMPGDGDLYIPCDGPGGPPKLIVRAMDYDWGKKDDLLGEIVLDVPALVAKGDTETFPLFRNRKQEKKAKIAIRASVSPTPNAPKPYLARVEIIEATGLRKADWFGKNDVYVQAYEPPEGAVLKNGDKCPEPEKRAYLEPGQYQYPFSLPVRADAPGSFESNGRGPEAWVRWDIYANVDLAFWMDPSTRMPINVLHTLPLPKPELLVPVKEEMPEEAAFGCSCFCIKLFNKGTLGMDLTVGRLAYAPGEAVSFTGHIINNTSEKATFRITLSRRQRLRDTTGPKQNTTSQSWSLHVATVAPGASIEGDLLNGAEARVPSDAHPSFFGIDSQEALQGNKRNKKDPVTWTYDLEVRFHIGKMGSELKSNFSFLVTAAPPYAEALPPAGTSPVVMGVPSAAGSVVPTLPPADPWAMQGAAVTTPGPCATAPTIGRGFGVPVVAYGTVVNVQDAGGEDKATVCVEPLQPVMGVWNAPIPAAAPTTAGAIELAATMDAGLDKIEALDTWCFHNRGAAASFTPDDVALVMSKVVFSMEQTGAAKTLASHMGQCTCAHVAAAVGACSFSKFDVTAAMAPWITDKRNKETVLSQLGAFDRTRAEMFF